MASTNKDGTPDKGRAGAYSYFTRNGVKYMRVSYRSSSPKDGHTRTGLSNKARFVNVNNAWRAFEKQLVGNFEQKKPGQTDYNVFVGLNAPDSRVYLNKQQVQSHSRVADHFIVAQGSLEPPIQLTLSGSLWVTDIEIPYPDLPEGTTRGDLSAAIIGDGERFWHGDELILYRTRNLPTRPLGDIPIDQFAVETHRLRLDPDDERPLTPGLLTLSDRRLALPLERDSLLALVHRRGDLATTQRLEGDNSLLARYATEEARAAAVESYGVRRINGLHYDQPRPLADPYVSPSAATAALTLDCLPPGSGHLIGGGAYAPGSEVRVAAAPEKGWRFLCWSDACTDLVRTLTVESDLTLTALFAPE